MTVLAGAGLAAAAVPALVGASPPPQATAARPPAFAKCAICHSVVKGGPNGVGPNLHGVVGRKAGAVPKYFYSPAMARSGLTWNRQALDKYIAKPAAVVPGGRMAPVATTPAERAAIIDYLAGLK